MYQIPLSALNEGQHLPFRRQGCKKCATELAPVSMPGWALSVSGPVPWLSQHPWASRGTLVVFSPFHTNFNLSFKSWVVFFSSFPFHSLRFSSCLSCWFLFYLIQPPPAVSASFILALRWSLELQAMEMHFPVVHLFSQTASESLSLMLVSSLWCSPEQHMKERATIFPHLKGVRKLPIPANLTMVDLHGLARRYLTNAHQGWLEQMWGTQALLDLGLSWNFSWSHVALLRHCFGKRTWWENWGKWNNLKLSLSTFLLYHIFVRFFLKTFELHY